MQGNQSNEWSVIGKSVRGFAHARRGQPNQDAIAWLPEGGSRLPLLLAVADGHGSPRCFRSDTGAQLAVKVVGDACSTLITEYDKLSNLAMARHWAEGSLPREIVGLWRDAVADDLTKRPFTAEEIDRLRAQEGIEQHRKVLLDPVLAYGTTLLSALVTESFILYVQVGDGDILTVSESGTVVRPMTRDERLFANETTSLATAEAMRDIQIAFQILSGQPPTLILLSTDGYANSFRDEEAFLRVGADLLEMIRYEGLSKIEQSLETWLTEASQAGSGDDITLGILCKRTS